MNILSELNKRVPQALLFWQSAVVFLFSLQLAQRIVLSLLDQENPQIIVQFCLYIFALILLQTGVCWLILHKWPATSKIASGSRWRTPLLVFPVVLVFNTLGLFLSYTKFAGLMAPVRLLILAVLFFALLELFRRGGRPLFIGLTLLCLSANAEVAVQIWQKARPPQVVVEDWRAVFPLNFRKIRFVSRPNVYLVSWDSLIPEKIGEEFLAIAPGTLEYARFLSGKEFRVFKNAFVDRVAYPAPERAIDPFFSDGSRVFHNSLLILDPNLWERLSGDLLHFHKGYSFPGQTHYFPGRRPSPLFEIFKENGYRVVVSYEREYFGPKGAYIDEFLIPGKNEGQCVFVLPWHYFQSAGFCHIRRLFAGPEAPQNFSAHLRMLLPVLRRQTQAAQPTLNFIYINSPGHTELNYHYTNPQQQRQFREQIIGRSKQTARYMKSIVDAVRGQDPEAIVLLVADHGAAMSRAMNRYDMADAAKRRFYFLDIHATTMAMYPATACAPHMNFATKYVTAAMVVRKLLVCLAGGEDPIDWEVDYSSPYKGVYFADYLYE